MLAHIAKEAEQVQPCAPVEVVDHRSRFGDVDKLAGLRPNGRHVGVEGVVVEQGPLRVPSRRITDAPGRPADEHERAMAGTCEAGERHQLLQVSRMQRVRCRIEPAVQGDGAFAQPAIQ